MAYAFEPSALQDLLKKAHQDSNDGVTLTCHKQMGSAGMYGPAVRTPVPFHPQRFIKPLKVPLCISMPPEPHARTPGAYPRSRPYICFALIKKSLYIYLAIQ